MKVTREVVEAGVQLAGMDMDAAAREAELSVRTRCVE